MEILIFIKTFLSLTHYFLTVYEHIFTLIKKLQEDIYADTIYTNALRPEENLGYKTKYNI